MKLEELANVLKAYANIEAGSLDDLRRWTSRRDLPARGREAILEFKSQLSGAIQQPGLITPKQYEDWTEVDVNTQEEVQAELQKIWNACFETE